MSSRDSPDQKIEVKQFVEKVKVNSLTGAAADVS